MHSYSNQIPQGYYSLNNSTVLSPPSHTHTRTYSTSRMPPTLNFKPESSRQPSQKKLTLTCQNTTLQARPPCKQSEGGLRKKGGDFYANKGKFISLQASRVVQPEAVPTRRDNEPEQVLQLKRAFRDKLRELQTAYSHSLSEYANQVRQLQVRLLSNSRELQIKEKKIMQLQAMCMRYEQNIKMKENAAGSALLSKKISDLEAKVRVIVGELEERDENTKVSELSQKIISFFGNKLENIKNNTQSLLQNSFCKISELQNQIEILKLRHQKHSEGTRGSMESVGEQPTSFHVQPSHDQCGMSFWDDCFFYPSEHSDNFQLIQQMAKRRDQPLSVWIDAQEYLRYTDTNSYLYNRKGDRIHLQREQILELMAQKKIILN